VNDHGFASAIMLALLALAGLLCLATGDAANVLLARARAQTAADAAALAAVAAQLDSGDQTPEEAATRTSEANGADLEECDCPAHGGRAVVTVSMATRVHMLGVAPSRVTRTAEASLDLGRVFERPR
jgi:Flp pilus assembly protein TadG